MFFALSQPQLISEPFLSQLPNYLSDATNGKAIEKGQGGQDQAPEPHETMAEQQQRPFAQPNMDDNNTSSSKGGTGTEETPPPPSSTRRFQAPSDGAALPASVAVRVRGHRRSGEDREARRGGGAMVSPPPLLNHGRV